MSLISLYTLGRKKNKNQKNECPYKTEPEKCSEQSHKSLDLPEKSSNEGHWVNMTVNGKRIRKKLQTRWNAMILIGLVLCLQSCESKVILLKKGEMRLLEDGSYAVSEAWIAERLQFENDMVKRLRECHAP